MTLPSSFAGLALDSRCCSLTQGWLETQEAVQGLRVPCSADDHLGHNSFQQSTYPDI